MTKARNLADMISDGVIVTSELADGAVTPAKLDETGVFEVQGLGINVSSPSYALDIASADTGANTWTYARLGVPSTATTANTRLFFGGRDNGTDYESRISGGQAGELFLTAPNAISLWYGTTTPAERLSADTHGVVLNDPGNDTDFRVESDTNTHALFVEGSSSEVGINTSTPDGDLHVKRASTGSTQVTLGPSAGTGGSNSTIKFIGRDGSNVEAEATITADYLAGLNFDTTYKHVFKQSATEVMSITGVGPIVNDQGYNWRDFRVESSTNTHTLFVDAGSGRVGINESSVDTLLHISNGSAGGAYPLTTYGNNLALESSTSAGLHFVTPNTGAAYIMFSDSTSPNASRIEYSHAATRFNLVTEGQMRLSVMNHVFLINENQTAMDFAFRSVNENAMFQIDSSADAVGIGIAAPLAERLHIYNGASGRTSFNANADDLIIESDTDVGLTLVTATPNFATINFANQYGQSPGSIQYDNATSYMRSYTNYKEWVRAEETSTTFNEIGYDKDFRVESDTQTHALFVQGSDGHVGINQSAPSGVLHINDPASPVTSTPTYNAGGDNLVVESVSDVGMSLVAGTTHDSGIFFGDINNPSRASLVYDNSTDTMALSIGSHESVNVDLTHGIVRMPQHPSFNGGRNSHAGSSGSSTYVTLVCNISHHNRGNHYNTSTGIFTCPVDGVYQCTLHGMDITAGGNGVFAVTRGRFYKNGGSYGYPAYNYGDGYRHYSGSWLIECSANDQLKAVVTAARASYNNVSISLVG